MKEFISMKEEIRKKIRLYGMDCAEHLKQYGFSITPYRVKDCLDRKMIKKLSLIPDDTVFFCRSL